MTMDLAREALIMLLGLGLVWFIARHSVAGYRVRAENANARADALEEQSLRFRTREMSDASALAKLQAQLEAQDRELRQQLDETRRSLETQRERADALARALAETRGQAESERRALRERTILFEQTQDRIVTAESGLRAAEEANVLLRQELTQVHEQHRSAREQLAAQQSWVSEQGQLLKTQFGELAGQLLAQKASDLQQSNNSSIDDIVSPLRQQLAEFQARVSEVHEVDARDRAGLSQLLDGLGRTQQQLSGHTEALARAMGTAPGALGSLGGMRLELQLQAAGFEEGRHYLRQAAGQDPGGAGQQSSLAIRLPDRSGYLPVDTALGLGAWEEAAAATSEGERGAALERHLETLRRHIDALGSRSQVELADGEKPVPFTLLYLPVEGAALAALERDPELLGRAHAHKVVLATPGTLFLVVGMVAQLWRVAAQELHARSVAAEGEALLRKLDEFVGSFSQVGAALDAARQQFGEADARLRSGEGNALAIAGRMKLLAGVAGGAGRMPELQEPAVPALVENPALPPSFEPMPLETEFMQ